MKLLVKICIDNVNFYDLEQIVNALNSSVSDNNTKIVITTNDEKVKFDLFEINYLKEINIPKLINYNLENLEWDILLPITKPLILSKGFDSNIKPQYKFEDLDGVLLLNFDNNVLPVIGRKYYENFGYIYNPVYKRKNFENEFYEVLKINKKSISTNNIRFKFIELKSDDDNIYDLRKKINFNL